MMKKYKRLIFLMSFTIASCSSQELPPEEYLNWFDNIDNNMIKDFRQGSIVVTCQYMTPEYISLKQSNSQNIDKAAVKENIEGLKNMEHFKLKFENTESNNFMKDIYTTGEEFNTRSMYLSFDIRFDLKLVSGKDTTVCALNHHERTYGNTPYETLLISFPKFNNKDPELELIFDDRVFGLGRVKFNYKKEELEAIPKLKI